MKILCVGDRFEDGQAYILSNQACRVQIVRVNDNQRTDKAKANFQCELYGAPGRREASKQIPEHAIVSSILADLIFRKHHGRRTAMPGPP